jgi:HTH-type transcriptional regulator/antitoxin HigA
MMANIKNEKEYEAIAQRVEELLRLTNNETEETNAYTIELDKLSDLLADYEEQYYPVNAPNLAEVLKLRMAEMNLTQAKLAELLGVSAPRISDYMKGKEPTLRVAREMVRKLGVDANIVLGV